MGSGKSRKSGKSIEVDSSNNSCYLLLLFLEEITECGRGDSRISELTKLQDEIDFDGGVRARSVLLLASTYTAYIGMIMHASCRLLSTVYSGVCLLPSNCNAHVQIT